MEWIGNTNHLDIVCAMRPRRTTRSNGHCESRFIVEGGSESGDVEQYRWSRSPDRRAKDDRNLMVKKVLLLLNLDLLRLSE